MGQRRTPRKVGRPTLITDDQVQKDLIDALKLGVPISVACQAANISESVFYKWSARGRDEHEARSNGEEPDADCDAHLDLYLAVRRARATAAVRNVGVVQKVAQGGTIIEETTERTRDPETGEIVERKTIKRQPPDWRAAAWYLERSHKDDFGKGAAQVEISGPDGGPVQIATDVVDLSRRISEHLAAGVATPLAITSGSTDEHHDE